MKIKIILLISSVILLNSCSLAIHRGERLYKEVVQQKTTYDAIIVPGVPLKNGSWDSVMKARVLWSVYLFKNNFTRNIIYSGSAVYTPYYEAKVMGQYAIKLGVPANHIFYDTLAKHSTENVYYSYKLAKLLKFKSLALATDPFQSALLKGFTKRRFMTHIQHIPVLFDKVREMGISNITIDPDMALAPNFNSIVENETFVDRLKGTLGRQINYGPTNKLGAL